MIPPQAPWTLRVRTTEPARTSAALGAYVALSEVLLGVKVPVPLLLQTGFEPDPELPAKTTELPAQMAWSAPALGAVPFAILM